MGANAAITFLLMNGWEPTFDEEELVDLVLPVASSALTKAALTEVFEARCRPIGDELTNEGAENRSLNGAGINEPGPASGIDAGRMLIVVFIRSY